MGFTVIGSGISPFVRKVMLCLLEKGLAYEHEDLNPFSPPENFREISPLGKIPAFRHDGRIVNDSSVICRYVEDLHPEPALYPADPYTRAQATWLEEYVDAGLAAVAGPKIFFPLVLTPLRTGREPDESGPRKAIEEELPPLLDYLEGVLGDDDFLVENTLSIADLTLGSVLVNLRLAGVVPEASRWPGLAAYVARLHARRSFETVTLPVRGAIGKRWVALD